MSILRLPLLRHPDSCCDAVERIEVEVDRHGRDLALRYHLVGRIADLYLPTTAEQRAPRALWQSSCCEVFIRREGTAYREWNLSPSGEWDCFAFRDYRQRDADPGQVPAPGIAVTTTGDHLCLSAAVGLPGEGPWRIGLSVVLAERGGRLSYWALAHPPGKPDFHHDACFACVLPAPVQP